MEIGLPTKWLYPDNLDDGREIEGEFTGTTKIKTKKGGEMEVVLFVCGEAEYQIAAWNLVCTTKFEVNAQKAKLKKKGNSIEVTLI